MVYLIPNAYNINQQELWISFMEFNDRNGGMENIIKKCNKKFLNFSVPRIEKLESTIDLYENMLKISKNNEIKFKSKVKGLLNIDKEGARDIGKWKTLRKSRAFQLINTETYSITANFPHIAFSYDLMSKRILFFINYNGELDNKNFQ